MTFLNIMAAESTPHISLVAEEVFSVGGLSVANSHILGLLGFGLILWIFIYTASVIKNNKKRNSLVRLIVWGFEGLYNTVLQIVPDEKIARRLAPLPITLFFFILIQYWLGVLPIVGPITFNGVPLFRGLAADLNATFALAIITMVAAQIYAIRVHGFFGNAARYFRNPLKDPAGAFEGILELIAEFSRLIGLSLRLFGNVFAGEVLLVMIAFLTVYVSPLALPPFYIFELFIGGIQAYIFFMLTTVFISIGLVSHDKHESDDVAHSHDGKTDKVKKPAFSGVET